MNLKIGKEYRVNHDRKGTFFGRLKELDETWATLDIVRGKAEAVMAYNEAGVGEEVKVRLAFCRFAEL